MNATNILSNLASILTIASSILSLIIGYYQIKEIRAKKKQKRKKKGKK